VSLTFAYRARTPSGERVTGTMRALDRGAALSLLRERMLIPSQLRSTTATFSFARLFRRARPNERLAFFRAYATLESAGVDFSTSFGLLLEQARTPRFRDALASIRADVERGGEKLWSAMAHRPDEFSDLEVAMVAAGEEAGNREEIFDRLASFLERDDKLRKQLQGALLYPALVLVSAIAVSLYIVVYVLPQFAKLFTSFGVEISPPMAILLGLSTWLANPFVVIAIAGAIVGTLVAAIRALNTPEGALAFDEARMRIPIFGDVFAKATIARLCRVTATLLESGVNQVRALEVAVPVAESPVYARAIDSARERIAAGSSASLEEALRASGRFPPLVLGFIRVGSSAGNIPAMLAKIAEYYEEDVAAKLAALPTLIQTAVTIGLGALVSAIVYIVYVPLSTLSSSIH